MKSSAFHFSLFLKAKKKQQSCEIKHLSRWGESLRNMPFFNKWLWAQIHSRWGKSWFVGRCMVALADDFPWFHQKSRKKFKHMCEAKVGKGSFPSLLQIHARQYPSWRNVVPSTFLAPFFQRRMKRWNHPLKDTNFVAGHLRKNRRCFVRPKRVYLGPTELAIARISCCLGSYLVTVKANKGGNMNHVLVSSDSSIPRHCLISKAHILRKDLGTCLLEDLSLSVFSMADGAPLCYSQNDWQRLNDLASVPILK